MRATTEKNNPRPLWDLSQEVAPGFIRLTRRGKAVGYLLLATHYDEEDIGYMTDSAFWKMIAKRSKGPFIPLSDVKAKLVGMDDSRRGSSMNGRKRGKRNGTS